MTVGRPRKIDPEIILENAMQVFWKKGYDGTTLTDIMAVTGMHKGSLYQTFGDKKSLFLAALNRYLDGMYEQQKVILNSHQCPTQGIRAVLFNMLNYSSDGQSNEHVHRGCLAVNTLVDSAPFDKDISDLLNNKHNRMIALMIDTITQIHQLDDKQLTQPPELVAGLIGVAMEGLSIEMRNNMSYEQASMLLDLQLTLLGI